MSFYNNVHRWDLEASLRSGREREVITEDDEQLIREYLAEKKGSNKRLSQLRVNKIASLLTNFRRFLKKPYRQAGITDIFAAIDDLKNGKSMWDRPFSQNSLNSYLRIVKPFLQWLIENKYSTLPEKKINKIQAPGVNSDTTHPDAILTLDEIGQLIKTCKYPRDKAIISTLYESGVRVGELARLRWRDAVFDEHGVKLYIDDQKTGKRRYSRLTMAREHLAGWRNVSPDPSPEAYIFINLHDGKPLEYVTVLRLLQRLRKAAKIEKKVTPHLFRKSRITHMVQQNYQESVIKKSMWGNVGTDMFQTYVRLAEDDIDKEFLQRAGIEQEKKPADNPLAPRPCPECHTVNAPTSEYCSRCGQGLTEEAVKKQQDAAKKADDTLEELLADPEKHKKRLLRLKEVLASLE